MFHHHTRQLLNENLTFKQLVNLKAAAQLTVHADGADTIRKRIVDATKVLTEFQLMTVDQRDAWGEDQKKERLQFKKNTLAMNRENRSTLSRIMADAYNWSPPTPQMLRIKLEMVQHLRNDLQSIPEDTILLSEIDQMESLQGISFYHAHVDGLQADIDDNLRLLVEVEKDGKINEAYLREVDASVRNSLTVNVQIPKGFLEKTIHQCVEEKFGSIAAKDVVHDFASKFSSANLVRGLITPNYLIPQATRKAMVETERQIAEAARKGEAFFENHLPTDQSTGC